MDAGSLRSRSSLEPAWIELLDRHRSRSALSTLTTETTYHYRVVVENANGTKYGADQTYTPHGVLGLTTEPASGVNESAATLNGSLLGDGTPHALLLRMGPDRGLRQHQRGAPGYPPAHPTGPRDTALLRSPPGSPRSAPTTTGSLPPRQRHQRWRRSHASRRPRAPRRSAGAVTSVHSDRALMHAQINANGGVTNYHFEYVDDAGYQSSGWPKRRPSPRPTRRSGWAALSGSEHARVRS